jgi:hypothetical protein
LSVVSPPPQPTALPPARTYADFDRWLNLATELADYAVEIWLALERLKSKRDQANVEFGDRLLASRPRDRLAAEVAKVIDGKRFYNRDELYDDDEQLSRSVIAEQVGVLLGSYPNAVPHDAEAYVLMMIEEIAMAEPGAIELEMACRRLRRTLKFPPTIPEMLEAIEKANDACSPLFWQCRIFAKGEEAVILERRKTLEAAVAEAKRDA